MHKSQFYLAISKNKEKKSYNHELGHVSLSPQSYTWSLLISAGWCWLDLSTSHSPKEPAPPPAPPAGDVVTLKVKSEDGDQTFVLNMFSSDTIGLLRHHLDKHRHGHLSSSSSCSSSVERSAIHTYLSICYQSIIYHLFNALQMNTPHITLNETPLL